MSEPPVLKADNLLLAVSTVVFTVFALSLGDALVKQSSGNFVLWQIFVLRSLIAIPCLVLYMALFARGSLSKPASFFWALIRSALLVLMWVCYYIALPHMPFSAAAAAYYTLPIFITLFSAMLVGDSINRIGWFAVFIGFSGVLLILKPSAKDFNWYALLPLFAAQLYALAMILTRTKCRAEHPLMLSLALNIAFVVVGGVAAFFIMVSAPDTTQGFLVAPWTTMGVAQWGAMCLLAISMLIGSVGAAVAYQNGPSSVIGVFDFAYVGFALLWGILFFSEIPDFTSLVGIALIVLAGVMSLRQ